MSFILSFNKDSKDKRVAELEQIWNKETTPSLASASATPSKGRGIYFVEPRGEVPQNADEYWRVFGYAKNNAGNYICLSDDEKFIEENNYLTALAMQEILLKRFGVCDQKILIVGWGKLTTQLEVVLRDADIHILNFNHHKVQELTAKYGAKAYFEKADLTQFPIIINTIPKQLIIPPFLRSVAKQGSRQGFLKGATNKDQNDKKRWGFKKGAVVYELASPPYGFDFGGRDPSDFGIEYEILPGLPGKFYPKEAARAVYNAITRYIEKETARPTIVLCITGSSCSYLKLLPVLRDLGAKYDLIPVLSPNANLPNRFTDIEKFRTDIREICGNAIITTIAGAEVLASNKRIAATVVLPATGNTIAKLTSAITDTCVCMAVKALLRNSKPCIIGISTNDALSGNATNIGTLLNRKNYYFIPFSQDDPMNKPFSVVCDFSKAGEAIEAALKGKQLQPIIT